MTRAQRILARNIATQLGGNPANVTATSRTAPKLNTRNRSKFDDTREITGRAILRIPEAVAESGLKSSKCDHRRSSPAPNPESRYFASPTDIGAYAR